MSAEDLVNALLVQAEAWMADGACVGLDANLFQLEQGQGAAKPREVCDGCGVSDECYEYGYRTGSVGVWGGRVLTLNGNNVVPFQRLVADASPQRISEPKRSSQAKHPTQTTIAARKAR